MRALIHQRVRKFSGKRLGESEVRYITAGEQSGLLHAKEFCEFLFEFAKERVISCRGARSSDIQSELLRAFAQRAEYLGVAREPKVIAPAEIDQLSSARKNERAIDLLKRSGERHGQCQVQV